ncbi:S8 family serine peptidase [Maritimibacter sp. DP07]|uniref:S8 family serine peptidase n=1 Tax=Maritimibacter harenae TaxID=2606218 RepID=A0A845M462_9RHOB|nr:S8 family serine peptidase [Maritimibacter harenae]MZR14815.1 S8 family serine peptidase [Maritimibacter harenae]
MTSRVVSVVAAMLVAVLAFAQVAEAQVPPRGGPPPGGARVGPPSDDGRRATRPGDPAEVQTFNGRTEYIAVGPAAEAAATLAALEDLGATLVRRRDYPGLGRVGQVVVLPFALAPDLARQAVEAAAPATAFDIHALYGFAQGSPRLFARDLVLRPGGCREPARGAVGIIDGPLDPSHPALTSARVETVAITPGGRPQSSTDHATAVAALIVGEDASGAVAGFARGARLVAVDAFSGSRRRARTDVDMIGAGLDVLLRSGVRLVNLSLSGPANRALADLLTAAAGQGVVMIAAAGNDGRAVGWPAAAPEVIAVTAVDAALRPYARANTGPEIEFAAPGVDVWVARPGGGAYASGTSYAAPIVTALAAQLGAGTTRSAASLRRVLAENARDLGPAGHDRATGWGLAQGPGC